MTIGMIGKKATWISIVVIIFCGIIRLALNKCQGRRYEFEPVYKNWITQYHYSPRVPVCKIDSLATNILVADVPVNKSGLCNVLDLDEFIETLNYAKSLLSKNDTIQLISFYDKELREMVIKGSSGRKTIKKMPSLKPVEYKKYDGQVNLEICQGSDLEPPYSIFQCVVISDSIVEITLKYVVFQPGK